MAVTVGVVVYTKSISGPTRFTLERLTNGKGPIFTPGIFQTRVCEADGAKASPAWGGVPIADWPMRKPLDKSTLAP